ncbi:FtsX-like permease family protein [Candidatus Gribaldobacteria bacterium]|nr:FtsX-like permease family protein [Candidatus Gribaldobacteria bacterium]
MFLTFKRVLKFGWQGFYRNKALSLQVVFILFVLVFTTTFLFLFNEFSSFLISETQEKVDISVYFKPATNESKVLEIKNQLEGLTHYVKKVDYISKEEAQNIFIEKHQDNATYLEALNQVEDNPFFSSLNISAFSPENYQYLADFFAQSPIVDLVEKISYNRNKEVIEKLFAVIANIKKAVLLLTIFFALLSALITFNTIKLSIFSLKREIATRKLVGADNWFIRGPFLAQAVLYVLSAWLIFNLIFLGLALFLNNQLKTLLLNFDLFSTLVIQKGIALLISQFLFAMIVALISSWFAVRKYLKV